MNKEHFDQIDRIDELYDPYLFERLDNEVLICECFCVCVKDIRECCQDEGSVDIDLLQKKLSLGTGCKDCIRRIDSWKNKIF